MDIIGHVFGRLTVTSFDGKRSNRYFWKCECACGSVRVVRQDHLRGGLTSSCGCHVADITAARNFRHGEASIDNKTPEYRSWAGAINRCHNPKNAAYERYGGRGIFVCERWRSSYQNFLADMGRRTSKTHSLDRFPDNDGPYSPDNCRWATPHEQRVNSRPRAKTRIKIEMEQAA